LMARISKGKITRFFRRKKLFTPLL
jgi:hypothetical protein